MQADEEGFLFPQIDNKKCVECGLCEKNCPMNQTQAERTGETKTPKAFAVINQNEEIRMQSSSGGVFTLLAEKIINDGGVVFGARFKEDWEVEHDYTETIEGLAAFRGSKYVQSKLGNSYKKARTFLEAGKNVLFTGTPCQIGGLKSCLQKDYEKLMCVDIICHGVPSPKVWQKYVEFRENIAKSKTRKIAFRRKNCGWMQFSLSFNFVNDGEYCQTLQNDMYMQAFLKDLCLRKSCYNCGFKTIQRNSDITIADFWGVQNVTPEMFDDKGTSLVLIQSHKGEEIFDKIKSDTNFTEVDCEKSLQFNPTVFRSCIEPKNRAKFMKSIDKHPFDRLVRKYTRISFTRRFFSFVRKIHIKIKFLDLYFFAAIIIL
jgi:coenzyme F420-reducing hydrogenase beta subunit